jgi:hypothetical protein
MPGIKPEKEIWFSPNASSRLKSLKPVFEKLVSVHRAYITEEHDHRSQDILYAHGERPHVGLLAVAAWLCRKTALEEYGCRKGTARQRKHGRGDLYIRSDGITFECEAKQVTTNLGSDDTKTSVGKILSKLVEATSQAATLEEGRHLGLVFVRLRISEKRAGLLDERLCDLKKTLKEATALPCEALIWIGMREGRKMLRHEGLLYPGLFLVIREAK